jgi:ribonucleoside-diphosphate reductase alpha chain
VFVPGNVSKKELHEVHFRAWKKGLKSLYYCRSTSVQRADKVSHKAAEGSNLMTFEPKVEDVAEEKYEECLSCQ